MEKEKTENDETEDTTVAVVRVIRKKGTKKFIIVPDETPKPQPTEREDHPPARLTYHDLMC